MSAAQSPVSPPLSPAVATAEPPAASADLPAVSALTLAMLTRMVAFLEEHHSQEEGLYRKDGPKLETNELVARCLTNELPDFVRYSLHSLTAALKAILADSFAPLIPYAISQQLLDEFITSRASSEGGHSDDTRHFHAVLTNKFALLSAATRQFLATLLLHLNHVRCLEVAAATTIRDHFLTIDRGLPQVSSSVPCRMSAKNLAVAVGVLLIRPTESTQILHTRTVLVQL